MISHLNLLRRFRRGVPVLLACVVLAPVAVVWDSLPAAPAARALTTIGSQANSTTTLHVAPLAGSSLTFRAKVTGVPDSAATPTGTVTFAIEGSSGPVQCDGLTNTVSMSGGVATCKVTSALSASGLPDTAWATYSGDGSFTASGGALYTSDGNFNSSVPTTSDPGPPAPTTTTTSTPTTTTTTTTTTAPSAGMAAPAGYTGQQMIFDDQFSGNSLDTSKWVTYLGAQGGVWNDHGSLPVPFSGPNTPITTEAAMFGPSQVSVNNGLTLTAQRNTNQYAGTFPWLSGVVTTEGKFSLPTGGWYVQVKARMPDQSQGMWPAIWFFPGVSGTPTNELDGYEGGWPGTDPNQIMHSDYFSDQGEQQNAYNLNADVTAGYHVYGFQFIPGQSITAFFDGSKVWQVNASSGITMTGEPYEIMLELQVASQQSSGWHTVPTGSTPSASMDVAEVQAYS